MGAHARDVELEPPMRRAVLDRVVVGDAQGVTERLQARVLQLTTLVYQVQLWGTFTWVQGHVQRALASSLKPWMRHSVVTPHEVLSC